jgi:hypothetical protein
MKNILVLTVYVVFMGVILAGCGVIETNALVGTWVLEDGQPFLSEDIATDYNLSKNGKGMADIKKTISWKLENKHLVITYEETSKTYELEYKLKGKNLIISLDGKDHIYIKTSGNSDDLKSWRSSIDIDPVNDEKNIYFRVVSKDGNYRLYIRQLGKKSQEMYIYWGDDIEIDRSNVVFRIDDGEPQSSRWDINRGKGFTVYTGNVLQVAKRLLDAKQVVARCSGAKGELTATFDVTGFKNIVEKYNDTLGWY